MSRVISLLEAQVTESDTTEGDIGAQRERNHRYYAMQPLGNEQPGFSHYIDPRVFSAVEDKKAVFDETFLSNRKVVWFNGSNHQEAEAKTAYVQRVLRNNHYEELFRDGWHDAFVAKRMTVWVDYKRNREEVTLRFLGAPSAQVNAQLAQLGEIVDADTSQLESVQSINALGQPHYVHTGILTVQVDKSYIHLDLIQPEYVMRDPSATYARDGQWNTARMDVARGELIEWGFEETVVNRLSVDYRWGTSEEDYARKSFDKSGSEKFGGHRAGEQQEVTIYKTRTWITLEEGDIPDFDGQGYGLYEIYWGHGEVLKWDDGSPAVKRLDEMGVYEWVEHKVSHAESGLCTADVEAHQQKAGSGLKRGVMDNMNITNNPRWEASSDNIRDMRDLYDNAIGGVIEVKKGAPVGQVRALDQPQLSPMVGMTMQMLDRDSEQRSGMSDASRGLNQDVLSAQNAESMVDKVAARGERRVAMAARSFANTFLIPLCQCIVRYAKKYDKSRDVQEGGGQQLVIAPSTWTDDDSMEVEVALTPGEARAMSQQLLVLDARLSQDEEMKPLYGLQQKRQVYDTVYELLGIKDSTKFLAPFGGEQHQRYMRNVQQQQQVAMAQQQRMQETQESVLASRERYNWAKLNNDIMDTIQDNQRADEELEFNIFKGLEELRLEEEQERGVAV